MKQVTNYTCIISNRYGFNLYRYYYMLDADKSVREFKNENYKNSTIVDVCNCELDDCLFESKLTFVDEVKCRVHYCFSVIKNYKIKFNTFILKLLTV